MCFFYNIRSCCTQQVEEPAIFGAPCFDSLLNSGYDGMHTIAGVINDTVLGCLKSLRYSDAVEEYEVKENRRFKGGVRPWEATEADFQLIEGRLQIVTERTEAKVTGNRFARLFCPSKKNKCHALHVFASPFGKYVLCGLASIGRWQREAYMRLIDACNVLQKKKWTMAELEEARAQVLYAICLVEAYLPACEMDMKLHALLHLPDRIRYAGPLWCTSMFTYESLCGKIADWGSFNKAHPEVTIMRCFTDMEIGFMKFWEDEAAFSLPAIRQFKEDVLADAGYHIHRASPYEGPLNVEVSRPSGSGEVACTPSMYAILHYYYLWSDERCV